MARSRSLEVTIIGAGVAGRTKVVCGVTTGEALARKAEKERTSKSEIIRRALRAYLGVED